MWLGSDASLSEYVENLEKFDKSTAEDFKAFSSLSGDEPTPDFDNPLMSLHDGIAIIEVAGSLTNIDNPLVRFFGMTPYSMVYDAFVQAAMDDRVEKIAAVFDTDGGTVKGLSSALEGINIAVKAKGVHSFVQGSMNSAGYWLGSASTTIDADKMAEIGSIGIIAVIKNVSAALEKEGVKVEVMRAGKDKARINPYEPLSEEVKAELQKELDRKHEMFIEAVAENLGYSPDLVRDKFGSGKVFSAEEALELGMISGVSTYNEFFQRVASLKSGSQESKRYGSLTPSGITASASIGEQSSELNTNEEVRMDKSLKEMAEAAAIEGIEMSEELKADAEGIDEEVQEDLEISAEDAAEDAVSEEEQTAEVTADDKASDSIITLAGKYAESVEQLAIAKAELARANLENETNEALVERFKEVTAESINRMQILMNGQAQDLKEVTASNLLEMHASLRAQVVKNIPTGQQAQEGVEDEAVDKAVNSFEQHAHLVSLNK